MSISTHHFKRHIHRWVRGQLIRKGLPYAVITYHIIPYLYKLRRAKSKRPPNCNSHPGVGKLPGCPNCAKRVAYGLNHFIFMSYPFSFNLTLHPPKQMVVEHTYNPEEKKESSLSVDLFDFGIPEYRCKLFWFIWYVELSLFFKADPPAHKQIRQFFIEKITSTVWMLTITQASCRHGNLYLQASLIG